MNDAGHDLQPVKSCHFCGMCSSGCPVNRFDPSFQPHRLVRSIGRGEVDRLLQDDAIWKCTTCFTCSEQCPQGIPVTDILWTVRSLAAAAGRMHAAVAAQKDSLLKTGRLYAASRSDHDRREAVGLPPLREDPLTARLFALSDEGE